MSTQAMNGNETVTRKLETRQPKKKFEMKDLLPQLKDVPLWLVVLYMLIGDQRAAEEDIQRLSSNIGLIQSEMQHIKNENNEVSDKIANIERILMEQYTTNGTK